MSDFDFIIDNIRFSYSSTSTFDTCPYAFKLSYIDYLMPREDNFFAEYGQLVHECMEKYFSGEIDIFELSQYYLSNYDSFVRTPAPPSFTDLGARYREEGLIFFDNFSFPRERYDVILIEDKIDFEYDGIMFVAKPDLVLFDKKKKKNILYDYKTSMPFKVNKQTQKETTDNKKISGYHNQMYIYAYALREIRNIPIKEIILWFTRAQKELSIPWNKKDEETAMKRVVGIVNDIKKEISFTPNTSNPYFCNNLCGVRNFCEYKD